MSGTERNKQGKHMPARTKKTTKPKNDTKDKPVVTTWSCTTREATAQDLVELEQKMPKKHAPIGITPDYLWIEERIRGLVAAMHRYTEEPGPGFFALEHHERRRRFNWAIDWAREMAALGAIYPKALTPPGPCEPGGFVCA